MKSFEIGVKQTQIFFLHGLRGHGLAQKTALQHIAKHTGVNIVSLELPGHGEESVHRHCLVPPFEQIIDNLCCEVKRHAIDAEQIVLMGYSFGAALMLLVAKRLKKDEHFSPSVAAYIGISTAFHVSHNVPKWQLMLSKSIAPLSRFFFERASRLSQVLTIKQMDISLISAEKRVQKSIARDPLVYKGRIPLATSAQVYFTALAAKKTIQQVEFPCLLLHSKDDRIALLPNTQGFASCVKLVLYQGLRHNCIDGVSREAVQSRRAITQFIIETL